MRPFRVHTPRDALELVRRFGLVTQVPAGALPSLVTAVVGGPVEGSWWGHAKGKKIYRLGQMLVESPEVLALKLVEGKVTFVHRELWPVVYRVIMDPTRRRRALEHLSEEARTLLSAVERRGEVHGDDPLYSTKAREALEERLLVQVTSEHTESGKHQAVLHAWKRWATPALKETAETLGYDEALEAIRGLAGGAQSLGPWVY